MPRLQTFILASLLLFVSTVAIALGQVSAPMPVDPNLGVSISTLQHLIGMGGSTSAMGILGVVLYKVWGMLQTQTAQFIATTEKQTAQFTAATEKQAALFTEAIKELTEGWREERKELLETISEHTGRIDRLLGVLDRRSTDAQTPTPLKGNRD